MERTGTTARLLGESAAMRLARDHVRVLGPVDTPVVIEGEGGTGKELVARAIHEASPRRGGPFVVLTSAGLAELFVASRWGGFTPGAFSGAASGHAEVFEMARGGTLLLDELAEVPLPLQSQLLRVLEGREVLRVEVGRSRPVDVRVLAATTRSLESEAAAGRFRRDLLYRLRVAHILLPPLRQRRGDIPLLAAEFLHRASTTHGKAIDTIRPDTMARLAAYRWPGNVRELEATIEWAVMRAAGPSVQPADLPPDVSRGVVPPARGRLATLDRQRILETLHQTGGNRSVTARLLGISRATLYRRLAALGLDDSDPQ